MPTAMAVSIAAMMGRQRLDLPFHRRQPKLRQYREQWIEDSASDNK